MNLDDLLKSIREEDDDSKGGKINADKFKTKSFKNPLVGQKFKAPGLPTERPVVIKVEPSKLIPKDDNTSKELIEKLDELIDVIKKDNELEKKEQDYDRKKDAKVKREKREKRVESKKLFANSAIVKKSVKKIEDIFNTILKFLGFTLLGQIVKFVTDFLGDPKNKGFIENTQEFIRSIPGRLKEAREKIQGVIDWFKGTVEEVKKFTKDFRELLKNAPFLGDLFKTAEEKEAEQRRREERDRQTETELGPDFTTMRGGGMTPFLGTDTVPAMLTPGEFIMSRGAVNMFGADTLMAMNKAGGGTNIPKFGLVSGYQGGGFVISREQQALLDAISFAEGTKKSYGTIYGGKVVPELEQGKLTLDQVHEMMMTGKLNGKSVGYGRGKYASVATGRYQLMPDTLRDIQRNMRLSGDTLLTPDMQDKMILDRVTHFRGVSPDMLRKEGLSTRVLDRLAPEFASFPFAPKGNQSYYGQPVKSPESIREAYKKSLNIQKTPPAQPAPPPVIPAGPSFGPGFDSNERAQSERLNLINLMYANRAKQSTNRFSGVDLDFIFKPIRQFLGIDTPNAPTSTKIIVLPAVKQTAQQSGTQVDNEIPNFRISSGVKMRGLVGKALGIEDLVS